MDMEIAKKALAQAENGDFRAAEATLTEYFDPDFVERELRTMIPLRSFGPRMELTKLALDDYRVGRYHASIPVLLAQIDGLVSELHERQRGFFAEDADMQAWDSLAAHSKGLNQLSAIFRKGRRKTSTERIDIPYRHGILHGRDLGYANQIVAAKTWAALFAVREWALKVERGELDPPPPAPEKGIVGTFRDIAETTRETERWKSWVPREVDWNHIEGSPTPAQFDDSSPERALAEYLRLWAKSNYGHMARFIPNIFAKYSEEPLPLQMRTAYSAWRMNSFLFKHTSHLVPALAEITVEVSIVLADGSTRRPSVTFRMMCEDADGQMASPKYPNARWVVMNWHALKIPG